MNENNKTRIFAIAVVIAFIGATYLMSKSEKANTHDYFHKYYLNR